MFCLVICFGMYLTIKMFLKPVWVVKIHGVEVYGGSVINFLYFNSKGCKRLPKKLPLVK